MSESPGKASAALPRTGVRPVDESTKDGDGHLNKNLVSDQIFQHGSMYKLYLSAVSVWK